MPMRLTEGFGDFGTIQIKVEHRKKHVVYCTIQMNLNRWIKCFWLCTLLVSVPTSNIYAFLLRSRS
jgi:hypothetical protein